MARSRRHVPKKPAGGMAHRDRGNARETYNLRGTVAWPTLADGRAWTAEVTRVRHAELEDSVGTIRQPELQDGAWTAVVDWDPVGRHEAITARHPLDNLLPA